jgi:hypothetical protein
MKKAFILLVAAMIGAFSSNAQLTVAMSQSNAQMGMRVISIMTGITPGNKVVRNIRVYDDLGHTATAAGLRDTFTAMSTIATRVDTLHTSVPYPLMYFITDTVTEIDSTGAIVDIAFAVNDSGIRLTPYFISPTQVVKNHKSDTTNAYFDGTFMSGYDDAVMTVIVSYGDTSFKSPVRSHPAVTDTIMPILGTTVQTVLRSVVIPIGVNNFPYSFRVYIRNGKKTDSSVVYKGRTHGGITSGVMDPIGKFPGYVSVYNLEGKLVYSEHFKDVSDMDKVRDNVPNTGIYILVVKTETGIPWVQEKIRIVKE